MIKNHRKKPIQKQVYGPDTEDVAESSLLEGERKADYEPDLDKIAESSLLESELKADNADVEMFPDTDLYEESERIGDDIVTIDDVLRHGGYIKRTSS